MNEPDIPRALKTALTKAAAVCTSMLPQVEYFEELARACPELDPAVNELRLKHEHLERLCRVGLRVAGQQQAPPTG